MADYSRPTSGIRFSFKGIKTNSSPDSMPENKSPYAQNLRAYADNSVQSRPPLYATFAAAGGGPVQCLDPTLGVYKSSDNLILNGVQVDTGYSTSGASLIPFRPNASQAAWEYVFDSGKSTKVLPAGPTVQKIGIAEPQAPVDASIVGASPNLMGAIAGGTGMAFESPATAPTPASRILSDTVQAVFADPSNSNLCTLVVSITPTYERFMILVFEGGAVDQPFDVFPAQPNPVGIEAIYYYTGTTGRCIVVPQSMSGGVGNEGQSIYGENFLSTLRRGSIVEFSSGELCYVLNVTQGPTGSICFETTTFANHTSAETFTGLPAIQMASAASGFYVNQTITSPIIEINLSGSGVGTVTSSTSLGSSSLANYQEADYMHVSVMVQYLANLTEFKILFDCGDGTFTENFYYYTARVSDLQAGIQNTLTQLGTAQLVEQRAIIDEEQSKEANNQGTTISGDQMTPGDSQWAELVFPISDLTRVGGDQTKTLQNIGKIQYLFNVSAETNASFSDVSFFGSGGGGGQIDVGDTGPPIRYWIRPRSSVTGAKGNPSPDMRYGVNPRRQQVQVNVPTTYSDPQADTWDIFRQGGALDQPTLAGSMIIGSSAKFLDNFSDDAITENEVLERDNYEPFPTIENPLSMQIVQGSGTAVQVAVAAANQAAANLLMLGLLPGNEVFIGSQSVYTVWTRPTAIGTLEAKFTYLLQFQENAGPNLQTVPGSTATIYEPEIANQLLPYVWGPDVNGTLFAVGDLYRCGSVSRTKQQNPDAAYDSVDDLCPPSEPLQNGVVMRGLSFVASPNRWWAGYPGQDAAGLLKYNWQEVPVGDGLAAPYGICTDGKYVYFISKDGIKRHANGPAESLTDADLYNLFPHEGSNGQNVTYNGQQVIAPSYANVSQFRLAVVNGWLYFDYSANTVDQFGHPIVEIRTLVMNTDTLAWQGSDIFGAPIGAATVHAGSTTAGSDNQTLFIGDSDGAVWSETGTTPSGEAVVAMIATKEEMPDVRANQMWGDASVDLLAAGGNVTITPMFLGVAYGTNTVITGGQTARQSGLTINLNGQNLARSMGLFFSWTDQGTTTILYSWQPSFVPQPEDFTNRYDDWDDCGTPAAKYIQGVLIMADTANVPKYFAVESSEDHSVNALSEMPGIFNGQGVQAFSLVYPFIAHMVRLIPLDNVVCRKWSATYIFEPAPEAAENWKTQGTSFGFEGFIHAQRVVFAYSSTTTVTLKITTFDGNNPQVVTLPNTNNVYSKLEFMLTPNKGRLYFFQGQAAAPWRPYVNACEVYVKQWNDPGPFKNVPLIGGAHGDKARV